jgi:hypothetical protein
MLSFNSDPKVRSGHPYGVWDETTLVYMVITMVVIFFYLGSVQLNVSPQVVSRLFWCWLSISSVVLKLCCGFTLQFFSC